ncbi:hypothetical protein ABZ769_28090 [Streptomyces olivoreticuli]
MTIRWPWPSRTHRQVRRSAPTLAAPPPPPSPAPTIWCRLCGCTAIDWQLCNDGCSGVQDQTDGRCTACIDPTVVINWSSEPDDNPHECTLCGAPFYAASRYCSIACEIADNPDDKNNDVAPAHLQPLAGPDETSP